MKITESKLSNIIENSIKKVLSEVDWKTYANAAKKAKERGEDERSTKFQQAADKEFNSKYGYDPQGYGSYSNEYVGMHGNSVWGKSGGYEPNKNSYAHTNIDMNGKHYDEYGELDNGVNYFHDDKDAHRFLSSPETSRAFSKASKEHLNYLRGNYKYDQNRGWTLNEQKLKNYIKGLVREMIEMDGGMNQFEDNYKADYPHKGENEKKPLHNPNGTSDQNNENQEEEQLRSSVEKFFQSPSKSGRKVDIAGYAYQLDGIHPKEGEDSNEMKNSRSLFMKKLNHEPNDQGYPYSFSTDEINRLASMISSNNKMNESRRRRK